jgi:hypothetical protein
MENKDYRGKGAKRICRKNINSIIIIIKQVLKKNHAEKRFTLN